MFKSAEIPGRCHVKWSSCSTHHVLICTRGTKSYIHEGSQNRRSGRCPFGIFKSCHHLQQEVERSSGKSTRCSSPEGSCSIPQYLSGRRQFSRALRHRAAKIGPAAGGIVTRRQQESKRSAMQSMKQSAPCTYVRTPSPYTTSEDGFIRIPGILLQAGTEF